MGCNPCVMESIEELAITVKRTEYRPKSEGCREKQIHHSFHQKIPKRYHSRRDKNGKSYPTMADVERYILHKMQLEICLKMIQYLNVNQFIEFANKYNFHQKLYSM